MTTQKLRAPRRDEIGDPSKRRLTEDAAKEAAEAFTKNAGSIRATAKALNINRDTLRNRLDIAIERGILKPVVKIAAHPSRWRPFAEIRDARIAEFERVKAAGDGRTIRELAMPDDGPFAIVPLGDPHLDSPGTDLRLFEKWNDALDARKHIYGIALGDWLDNWPRVLSFLYAVSETPAPEGFILLEEYLKKYGRHYVASVSGNHDDWSGHSDVLGKFMRDHDILHRNKSLRVGFRSPNGRLITCGLRHRYPGNSMWNPAHAVMKMAQLGWRDHILAGGDKHVSNDGFVRDPNSGMITHCFQVAAFKTLDDYADDLGLMDKHVSAAVFLVIDPSREDGEHALVSRFYDAAEGTDYLKSLRKRRGF